MPFTLMYLYLKHILTKISGYESKSHYIAAYETSFAHAGMKQWQWYIIHLVRSTYKF